MGKPAFRVRAGPAVDRPSRSPAASPPRGTVFSGGILSSRRVSFQGPPLTRRMRGSLSAAQITMIDRRRAPGWDGQLQKYLVSVEARDGEDAVRRVLAVLEPHGSFSAFAMAAGLDD
jgi:hypothetical protein